MSLSRSAPRPFSHHLLPALSKANSLAFVWKTFDSFSSPVFTYTATATTEKLTAHKILFIRKQCRKKKQQLNSTASTIKRYSNHLERLLNILPLLHRNMVLHASLVQLRRIPQEYVVAMRLYLTTKSQYVLVQCTFKIAVCTHLVSI